jgi:hypothetical protein
MLVVCIESLPAAVRAAAGDCRQRHCRFQGVGVREFMAQVERLSDGSLRVVLYDGGLLVRAEPVHTVRQGKRRAHDLACSAVDEAMSDDVTSKAMG